MSCTRLSILCALALSAACYAAPIDGGGKALDFAFQDISLQAALDTLIIRYSMAVLYIDSDVEGKRISARCESCSEEEALASILKSTGLDWRWTGTQFVVTRRRPANPDARTTVSGTVVDSVSNESISGATLFIVPDSSAAMDVLPAHGCSTNKYGFFSFPDIRPGAYTIIARSVGFTTSRLHLLVSPDVEPPPLMIRCVAGEIPMDEIIVERDRAFPGVSIPGVILIDPGRLSDLPALGGETDLLRGLQLLPGVKSISELSSGLYIRGTTSDQNLYLLDGATLYNPTHLGGFISTINPDALRDTRLSMGMFSPEHGERIGGVVDMMEREGTQERIRGTAGLSFLDARFSLEGPIKDGTTFMVAARRAYFDLILPLVVSNDDPGQRYYFYDVTAKVNTRVSESDHIFASGYLGRDVYYTVASHSAPTDIWWGNSAANLRWTHVYSPKVFTAISAVYSTYNFSAEQRDRFITFAPDGLSTHSGIQDITVKGMIEYYAGSRTTIRAGLDLVRHQIRADVGADFAANSGAIFDRPVITPLSLSLWVSDRWKADDVFAFDFGARLSRFSSHEGMFTRFEPRVSAEIRVAENLGLHGVVSESSQFLHSLMDQGLVAFFPTNVMYPSTERVLPSSSLHMSAGAEMRLFDGSYSLTSDFYWRTMRNIHAFRNDADFSAGADLESQILSGSGKSYGVEVLFRKQEGSFSGWLGYSISWTTLQFAGLNGGAAFYPRWDRRHEIAATLSYALGEHWEFGATWTYGTGQPYTLPSGVYYFNANNFGVGAVNPSAAPQPSFALDYATIDGSRLPPFHKFDFVFIHKYHWFGLPFQLSLNLYNAYSRMNAFAYQVHNESNSNLQNVLRIDKYTLFPIIPSLALSVKF